LECGQQLDRSGFHALSCSTGKRLKKRHDDVAHVLSTHVQRARLKVSEDVAIMRDGRANRPRPADLRIRNFVNGKDAAIDVTIVAPLQKKYLSRAAAQIGVAAFKAEKLKRRKYSDQCRQHDVIFFPVAGETYGGWGASARDVFERIIAKEAAVLERPMGPVRRQLYCDLAISIARNAARAILERLPENVVDHPLPDA
jgi:ABC-type Fe3+/spermidine/putrescine transport system ATPase subunit